MRVHGLPKSKNPIGRLVPILVLLLTSLAFMVRHGYAATSISASLNPTQFSVDDNAVLTVTVNGNSSAHVRIPHVTGISIQRSGQSSRVQIINGSFSSSISYTYVVQANKPGKYTIPPIQVVTGGGSMTTEALTFQVTQAGGTSSNQGTANAPSTWLGSGQGNKIAFLRVQVEKKKSWVGQDIPIQIKAYFRQNVKTNINSLPILKGDGFVMPQLNQKPPQTEETVNGTEYSVLTWNTTLSAVKEGMHTLSLELDATLLFPQRINPFSGFGDQDIFQDKFFQNFFGGYKSKNVKITSSPITIEARQLPTANQPPDFSGAIGHFKLSVTAKPDKVSVGDPITLTMTVSGEGNFDRVETPKFPDDPKWKSYPPSSEFKPNGDPAHGSKKFEQAIVVKNDSVTEIPPVTFTFFNPTTEKYETLNSGPLPLSVKKSASAPALASAAPPPSPANSAPKTEQNNQAMTALAPIHLEMGTLVKKFVPLFARTWFVVVLSICVLLLLFISFWKIHLRHLERNPNIGRKKKMQELLARNMQRVKMAADRGDSREYLASCRRAIQEVLGNRWQMEPSAITLADLQARLDPSSGLLSVFADAEQCAYASFTLSHKQIRNYTIQLQKELSEYQ